MKAVLLGVLVCNEVLDDMLELRELFAALTLLVGSGTLVLLPLGFLGLTATIPDLPALRLARIRTRAQRMALIGLVVSPGLIGVLLLSISAWLPHMTWALEGDGMEYLPLIVFAVGAAMFPFEIFA